MRLTFQLLILFALRSPAAIANEHVGATGGATCDVQQVGATAGVKVGLSPYWAQDQVGADLAREFMNQNLKRSNLTTVNVVDIDSGLDRSQTRAALVGKASLKTDHFGIEAQHGTQVVNVLAGEGRYGVGNPTVVKISDSIPVRVSDADIKLGENQAASAFDKPKEDYPAAYKKYLQAMNENERTHPNEIKQIREVLNQSLRGGWTPELKATYARLAGEDQTRIMDLLRARDPSAFEIVRDAMGKSVSMQPLSNESRAAEMRQVDTVVSQVRKSGANLVSLEIHTLVALNSSRNEVLNHALGEMSNQSVVVASAGNYFEADGPYKNRLVQNPGVIIVGSTHPTGLASLFSNTSPDVTIMAPSDEYLFSPYRRDVHFGGTSGAQPVVNGALANAMSILGPKTVTGEIAKRLLEKTATPLDATGDGPGEVNALRLVEYAARLKQAGWPKDQEKLLANARLLDFTDVARENFDAAARLKNTSSCLQKAEILNDLRRAFLLSPTREVAREIAKIYHASKFPLDASFYDVFGASPTERREIAQAWINTQKDQTSDRFEIDQRLMNRNPRFFEGVARTTP